MGTTTLKWIDGKQFVGIDSTHHAIVISSTQEAVGVKPSDLLPLAVASCSAIDVVDILAKKRMPINYMEIEADGEQDSSPPWTFRKIHLHFRLGGDGLVEKDVAHAIDLAVNKYCSVAATVRATAPITTDFEIITSDLGLVIR
jgi:putative redox protein